MLILHAPNIHQGGGRTLLIALIGALAAPARLHLDERMRPIPDLPEGVEVVRFAPTLSGRIKAERVLQDRTRPGDRVLCLGNLPPLLRLRVRASVFVQNRYLVDRTGLADLPLKTRLRLLAERLWLRSRHADCDIIVQSETMARQIERSLGRVARVVPFLPMPARAAAVASGVADFIYVASGEAHKNHAVLIEAWERLARQGITPSLDLTIDAGSRPDLAGRLQAAAAAGARIRCLGGLDSDEVAGLYQSAKALIYPSLFESFGLPLLEAKQAGLPVLAPERDYVRDVIEPDITFDPTSQRSIARAVRRFLGVPDAPAEPLDPAAFLAALELPR